MRNWFLTGLVVLLGCGPLLADGLAYSLPPDGTWVKYKITIEKYEAWKTRPDPKKGWLLEKEKDPTAKELAEGDIVVVRSVGKQEVNRVPCRWIEMVLNAGEEGKKKPEARVIVLKILVPEQAFAQGRDPFEHIKKMYLSDTNDAGDYFVNEIKDKDHQKYEVERFRPYFPIAPKDANRGKAVERKTPGGLFKGRELAFEYSFEGKLSQGSSGWNWVKGPYVVVASDRTPFGIAAVTARDVLFIEEYGDGHGARLKQSWMMEVAETGKDAKSAMPDKR
jgi:hypothetical protein